MRSVAIRFVVSAAIAFAAGSLYLLQGSVLSAAAAPWLWVFLLEIEAIRPTSPLLLFLATTLLLAVGAVHRRAGFIIAGWCLLNVALALAMNFQLYSS